MFRTGQVQVNLILHVLPVQCQLQQFTDLDMLQPLWLRRRKLTRVTTSRGLFVLTGFVTRVTNNWSCGWKGGSDENLLFYFPNRCHIFAKVWISCIVDEIIWCKIKITRARRQTCYVSMWKNTLPNECQSIRLVILSLRINYLHCLFKWKLHISAITKTMYSKLVLNVCNN